MENPLCRLKSDFSGQNLCVFGVICEKKLHKKFPPKKSLLWEARRKKIMFCEVPLDTRGVGRIRVRYLPPPPPPPPTHLVCPYYNMQIK